MVDILMVGAGSITQSEHLPNWLATPGARIVGVVSRSRERGEAVAGAYGLPWYPTLAEGLAAGPDACHIAAHLTAHPALVREALEAGVHVLVEKPFAESAATATELVALAQDQGLVFDVGYQKQFDADIAYVTGLVASGRLGALTSVHSVFPFSQTSLFQRLGPLPDRVIPDAHDLRLRLLDQSIHHINVFHTWLGTSLDVATVQHRGAHWLIAGTSPKAVFSHLNVGASGHGEQFWAYFEGGSVHVSVWSPHIPATPGSVDVLESWADRRYQPITPRQNPYKLMLAGFLDKIAGADWLTATRRAIADLDLIERIETVHRGGIR
ncbi:MAG: Gfo/Idh/MocA family oxidoreductase [Propionibacteriaceae bacterium]|jgi:predicted dehydrogenase|nr:Gfo/Idh/MocA family oxidoreductase [Propionibacteriaceae bacterium]